MPELWIDIDMRKEYALLTFMLTASSILFYESFNIAEKSRWQSFDSATYPRVLILLIAIFALGAFIESLMKNNRSNEMIKKISARINRREQALVYLKTASIFIYFSIYALALPQLGYIISTGGFMLVSQATLLGVNTIKKLIMLTSVSVIFSLFIYFVFRYGLKIWLP
ncbi:tripartite tricarboxylate transporter TctB family protein [Vreelandella maris]|uniref:Tripartite tricarboxylate transporter TctB family protein n=1 Tax=Vreelandella maris TaxID=2729617 RepID=A0A7Y6REU9_9GAMM|nr:tripartite tricarboxylate transporter TctB family protein [Halomonas maris]NVF15655.1 tripartite tricarboxylate transporter TctB family protein [Halomonas maris]